MDQLAAGLGPEPVFSRASGTRCSDPRRRARRPGGQRLRVDAEPGRATTCATRPYYVYQLQLMAPRGRPGPVVGRPDAAAARRRALAGRRAGRLGGRDLRARARRATRRGRLLQRGDRRHDGRRATARSTPPSRTSPPRGSTATSIPTLDLVGPPVGRGYYVIYLRTGTRRCATRSTGASARLDRSGRAAPDLRAVRHLDRRPGGAGRAGPRPSVDAAIGRRDLHGLAAALRVRRRRCSTRRA